jgi:hypothetical protein
MIAAAIEHWARGAAPGMRRYRVYSSSGRTILYSTTIDGQGQQFACYASSTEACRAIDSDDIAWRLDLRREIKRRERAAVAP